MKARNYQFRDCTCQNSIGVEITIPDGIWPVGELAMVAVYVSGNITHTLSLATFQLLKLNRKAILVD